MYYKNYDIRIYEVDKNGRLSAPYLLNYFQDVMIHNVDSYGAGTDFHLKKDLVWVLIDYEIDIVKLPYGKTTVTCGTIPYSFKRYFGYRKWELLDEDKNILATAKGKFVLMNIRTKDIVTPSNDILELFADAVKEPTVLPFSKNPRFNSKVVYKSEDKVGNTYIDVNNHMNNVYYLTLAYNNIPSDILDTHFIENIRITYKKESLLNDKLVIEGQKESNVLYFEIKKGDVLLAQIRFTLKTNEDFKTV